MRLSIFHGFLSLIPVWGEQASDDVFAMLQSSQRLKQQSRETALQRDSKPDMITLNRWEKTLVAKLQQGKLFKNETYTAKIHDGIKNLTRDINATAAFNQQTMADALKIFWSVFNSCKKRIKETYAKVAPLEKIHSALSEEYSKCIEAEKLLKIAKQESSQMEDATKDLFRNTIRLIKAKGANIKNVCSNLKAETHHEQLIRLERYYRIQRNHLKPHIEKRDMYAKLHKKRLAKKVKDASMHKAKVKECKKMAWDMTQLKCKAVTTKAMTYTLKEGCWKGSKKRYDTNFEKVREEEGRMLEEWKASKRIQCYLAVLDTKDPKKYKDGLNKCMALEKKGFSTKHLRINPGKQPKKVKCRKKPKKAECPCTPAYFKKYLKVGPRKRCTYMCPVCKIKKNKK